MKERFKILIVIIILILLGLIIRYTYSKYTNDAVAVIEKRIGQWVIKINDTNITTIFQNATNEELLAVGTDFLIEGERIVWYKDTTKTKEVEKLFPGGCGSFYIEIDPAGTDTSLEYTIEADQSALLAEQCDISITSVTELNSKPITVSSLAGNVVTITGRMDYSEIRNGGKRELKFDVDWAEDPDRNDTSKSGLHLDIPISVNVLQYTGE